MDYNYELKFNDGNGVSEDGRSFKVHQHNPRFGEDGQPEFIEKVLTPEEIVEEERKNGRDCTVEDVLNTFAAYKESQEKWATSTERYNDTQKCMPKKIELREPKS